MRRALITFAAISIFAVGGMAPAAAADSPELAEFKVATRKLYDLKENSFANHEAEPILTEFYSPDVISTDSQGNTHIGTAALAPLYAQYVKTLNVKIVSAHPYVNGNAGWDWVDFHIIPRDTTQTSFTMKILFLWERVDGRWRCKGEMSVPGSFAG